VALDPALVAVAKRAAERFVNEPGATEASVLAATEREFDKFSLVYRRVSSLITLTARLDDAATLEPALSTEASAIGLGIAQDTRAEGGSLVIVLLVGSRR
jgi:hypothetical protein